jgi:hypothetical protein
MIDRQSNDRRLLRAAEDVINYLCTPMRDLSVQMRAMAGVWQSMKFYQYWVLLAQDEAAGEVRRPKARDADRCCRGVAGLEDRGHGVKPALHRGFLGRPLTVGR